MSASVRSGSGSAWKRNASRSPSVSASAAQHHRLGASAPRIWIPPSACELPNTQRHGGRSLVWIYGDERSDGNRVTSVIHASLTAHLKKLMILFSEPLQEEPSCLPWRPLHLQLRCKKTRLQSDSVNAAICDVIVTVLTLIFQQLLLLRKPGTCARALTRTDKPLRIARKQL